MDELHSSDIQGDQMERGRGVTRSIIDEFQTWDIQGEQMGDEIGFTRRIIDELDS